MLLNQIRASFRLVARHREVRVRYVAAGDICTQAALFPSERVVSSFHRAGLICKVVRDAGQCKPRWLQVLPADEDFDVKGLTYLLNFIEAAGCRKLRSRA